MYKNNIPIDMIRNNAEKMVIDSERSLPSYVELCRITAVNTANKTVSAYFLDSKMFRANVPYCYSAYGQGCGIISVPMVGSIGVAIWDSNKLPIILTYTSPLSVDEFQKVTRSLPSLGAFNIPDLLEGEILIISSGRSFIRFDSLGGVRLSSSLFAYIYLDESGGCTTELETGNLRVNGIMEEIYTENFSPTMKIVKGRHLYSPTQQIEDSVELCYRVSVVGHEGDAGFIGIDTEGRLHVCGDIVYHKK